MKKVTDTIKKILSERFNLDDDRADEVQITEAIIRDTNFKGTNLWTLIFAIFIASIGLNVNSTAVIIGAMLISPLMGPIMGVGLGIGTNDFDLIKKGGKNLLIAAAFSVATSCLYFAISPLHDASSELLARTNPSLWDVFIAFFGGLAGIVAGTRKQKSNVIPGVAIATALMPPLCTAGFGLATGQLFYFLGALYLFFINSVFICLATFLIVRHLRFQKKEFSTSGRERQVSRYILFLVFITASPSIYLAYRIVQRSIFEGNAKRYIQSEFHFAKTQVVTKTYNFDPKHPSIDLLLIGQPLERPTLDSIENKLPQYALKGTKLIVHQGLDAKQKIDFSEIKASVLEEVFASGLGQDSLRNNHDNLKKDPGIPDLAKELHALFPAIDDYSLSKSTFSNTTNLKKDTVMLFAATFKTLPSRVERQRLEAWLRQRVAADSVAVYVKPVAK